MDLKRKLHRGDRPVGGWCSLPSAGVAELLATAAFDFVTVDAEHAPTTTESAADMVRAVEAAPGETETLVRVADADPVRIKRLLDTGPAGIMAPRIHTPEAAREFVEACRYPPQVDGESGSADGGSGAAGSGGGGTDAADRVDADGYRGRRGVAGSRASDYGRRIDEYVRTATDEIAVIAQIETERAVESAGEIAAVPGIDALFVGPADLSAALGRFRAFDDPTFVDAMDAVLGAADDAGVPVGTLATSDERIDAWLDAGFDFLIVGTDAGFLSAGADRAIERYESGL